MYEKINDLYFCLDISRRNGFDVIRPFVGDTGTVVFYTFTFNESDLCKLQEMMPIFTPYMITDNESIKNRYIASVLNVYCNYIQSKHRVCSVTDITFSVKGIMYHTQLDMVKDDITVILAANKEVQCCTLM